MSDINITINGDVIINIGDCLPSELEDALGELAEAVIEDESTDTNDYDKGYFTTALIFPNIFVYATTFGECADYIDKMENRCEFYVDGECFTLVFEHKGLMTFLDENYLVYPAFALFHDEQDKAVSGNIEMLDALNGYIRENSIEFRFGNEIVAALRLEGEIVEGV